LAACRPLSQLIARTDGNRTIGAMRTPLPPADAGVVDKAVELGWCEFRIRGRLGRSLLGAFPNLHAEVDGSETVLTGPLPDQAAVHGVLAQIEALSLELLEFRRVGR
jgi:hypothetical protein